MKLHRSQTNNWNAIIADTHTRTAKNVKIILHHIFIGIVCVHCPHLYFCVVPSPSLASRAINALQDGIYGSRMDSNSHQHHTKWQQQLTFYLTQLVHQPVYYTYRKFKITSIAVSLSLTHSLTSILSFISNMISSCLVFFSFWNRTEVERSFYDFTLRENVFICDENMLPLNFSCEWRALDLRELGAQHEMAILQSVEFCATSSLVLAHSTLQL